MDTDTNPNSGELGPERDDRLIGDFIKGNRSAFDEIYNLYKNRILNYLHRLLGDRHAAEELTQETFISAYMHMANYNPMGMFKSWLYKIASNLAKSELRRRGFRKTVSLSGTTGGGEEDPKIEDVLADERFSPERIVENEELKAQIEEIVGALPVVYREVLVLCVMEGLSYEEAASALGTNVKTISSRLARAREIFIKKIKSARGEAI